MKNKMGITIIISLIIISLIFSLGSSYTNKNSVYVVVEDKTVWKKTGSKWTNSSLRNLKRMSFDEFYSFGIREYLGKTYLHYDKQLEVYDKNYEKIDVTNGLLSIKTPDELKNTKVAEYDDVLVPEDDDYVKKVLEKYSISDIQSLDIFKYRIDIDHDGKNDTVYNINNFYNGEEKNQAYSVVFSVINDNIDVIDKIVVDASDELKSPTLYLRYVVDVDSDDNYEFIILKTSYGNSENDCNVMYKYDNDSNKYVKLIGC